MGSGRTGDALRLVVLVVSVSLPLTFLPHCLTPSWFLVFIPYHRRHHHCLSIKYNRLEKIRKESPSVSAVQSKPQKQARKTAAGAEKGNTSTKPAKKQKGNVAEEGEEESESEEKAELSPGTNSASPGDEDEDKEESGANSVVEEVGIEKQQQQQES